MAIAFADSSAPVKLYTYESGADIVQSLPDLAVSQLARVKVPAALWRKHRIGELSATGVGAVVGQFEADYFGVQDSPGRFVIIALTAQMLDHAARLVGVHGLRGYDSVQLASASAAAEATEGRLTFAAFDKTLRTAAAAEGFELLPD